MRRAFAEGLISVKIQAVVIAMPDVSMTRQNSSGQANNVISNCK